MHRNSWMALGGAVLALAMGSAALAAPPAKPAPIPATQGKYGILCNGHSAEAPRRDEPKEGGKYGIQCNLRPPEKDQAGAKASADGRYGILCNERAAQKPQAGRATGDGRYGIQCNERPPNVKETGKYGIQCDDLGPKDAPTAPDKAAGKGKYGILCNDRPPERGAKSAPVEQPR